jgi:hexosaminidase
MNKLSVPALLLLVMAGLTLSACGSSSSTPSGGTPSSLSHVGKVLPRNSVDPATTSLFSDVGRAKAAAVTDSLAVIYEVVENHGGDAFPNGTPGCSSLAAEYSSCSVANLHINGATGTLNDGYWKLYFHSIRRILRVHSDEFSVSLVNGDLNYLEPTNAFTGFDGSIKTVGLVTEFNHLIESDFMPRYWLVQDNNQVTIINNTDNDTDESAYSAAIADDNRRAFNGEPIPLASASSRFDKNRDAQTAADTLSAAQIQARIIPRPSSVTLGTGTLDIGAGFSFAGAELSQGAIAALQSRQQTLFLSTTNDVPLSATINTSLTANTYELDVSSAGISITGSDNEALFYGAQSLLALIQPGVGIIPVIGISDTPRLTCHGLHIDVARNFHSLATIKKIMDQMAAYKLNKLHMHLSDD